MEALVTGRQEGKTTRLMSWVKCGIQVEGYPGWSRVAIVPNRARHDYMRSIYWKLIDDFDHRVYTLLEVQQGHFPSRNTSYRLDDLDEFIPIFLPGIIIEGFTMTGSLWDEEHERHET
jgi:hypothetical protein